MVLQGAPAGRPLPQAGGQKKRPPSRTRRAHRWELRTKGTLGDTRPTARPDGQGTQVPARAGLRHQPRVSERSPGSKFPSMGTPCPRRRPKKRGTPREAEPDEPSRTGRRPKSPRPPGPAPPGSASRGRPPGLKCAFPPPGNPGGMKGGRWRKAGAFRPRQKLGSRADFQ